MTYKELVNAVLVRLREDTVSSVQETFYSRLVGAFVNDAKRAIEDSWPWKALIRSVNIPVTENVQATFDLEDYSTVEDSVQFNTRARLYFNPETSLPVICVVTAGKERDLCLYNTTDDYSLDVLQANAGAGGPLYGIRLATNPSAQSGKSPLRIVPVPLIPNTTETLRLLMVNPPNDLLNDTDALTIPSDPVIQLAYVYCLYERGEELGELLSLTTAKADVSLSDAISREAQEGSQVNLQVY